MKEFKNMNKIKQYINKKHILLFKGKFAIFYNKYKTHKSYYYEIGFRIKENVFRIVINNQW